MMAPRPKPTATGPRAYAGQMTEAAAYAKRDFDREDWARARRGFAAMLRGDTGDDLGNRQIAAYFSGIASYRLGELERALAAFRPIARATNHYKHRETLFWLSKLAQHPRVCTAAGDVLVGYFPSPVVPLPQTTPEQRDAASRALYAAGRSTFRSGEFARARALLTRVPRNSRYAPLAAECLMLIGRR